MNTINQHFIAIAVVMLTSLGVVSAQIEVPRPSPAASVSTKVGLTDIKIDYFRPKMKGRKLFGIGDEYLLPYGKIWRTGANSGTVISFSDDVKVQGNAVPKGEYLIFTWPDPKEWTVALYKDLSIGGSVQKYDKAKELVRFTAKPEKLMKPVELLTINITDIPEDSKYAHIQIAWGHTAVKFQVDVEYDQRVMAAIKTAKMEARPRSYVEAASYYYKHKKDLKQALVWMDKYLSKPGKDQEFYNVYLKAQIQHALNQKAAAMATAKQALETAKKATNDFGYIRRVEELIAMMK